MNRIKKSLRRFVPLLLVAVLLGIGVYNLNSTLLLGDPMPMPFGVGSAVVLTGSMEPKISAGDLIIVKKTDEIAQRDIVVYKDGSTLVVHRVNEIDGDTVITQGDANNTPDAPISREAIKGKVIFTVPYVGRVIGFLRIPLVTILLMVAAVWLMERSFKKEKNVKQDELEALKNELNELKDELKK